MHRQVNIGLDVEKLVRKSGTATYAGNKEYIEKTHKLKVPSLYIGHIERQVLYQRTQELQGWID